MRDVRASESFGARAREEKLAGAARGVGQGHWTQHGSVNDCMERQAFTPHCRDDRPVGAHFQCSHAYGFP